MGIELKVVLLGSTFMCAVPMAHAQAVGAGTPTQMPAGAKPDAAATAGASGEIVVAAQREQKMSDVGMAITAVSGDALVQRNVTEIAARSQPTTAPVEHVAQVIRPRTTTADVFCQIHR